MTAIFLFGTLCHAPLRARVLGDPASHDISAATLRDHALCWSGGVSGPTLAARTGAVAQGGLLRDLSEEPLARLDFVARSHGQRPAFVQVMSADGPVEARIYSASASAGAPELAWDVSAWAERWGALACETADEIVMDMGRLSAGQVGQRLGPIRARAQARLNAQTSAPTTLRRDAAPGDVRLKQRRVAYSNFFSVEEYDLAPRAFAGGFGPDINRAAFVSADAVTVLPYDPARDRVLLVEQFRAGPYARGDAQPWVLEPIAGRIDGGETPEQSARREAQEEAGLELDAVHLVGEYYASPGAKTEYLYGYIATADLPDGSAGIGGLESEGEDIRSHVISFDRAMDLIQSGEINIAPLIVLLLHLARMRPGLRSGG